MILFFTIDKQIITRRDNEKVVRDSVNYLHVNFSFSEEWTGDKTAVFKSKSGIAYNVLVDSDGSCLVPWEVLKEEYFEVSAFCGDLITANVVKVFTIPSGYEIGSQGRIPTPDIYAQIIARLSAIEAEIDPTAIQQIVDEYLSDKDYVTETDVEQIVSDYVEAHKDELKGDTGATGPQGPQGVQGPKGDTGEGVPTGGTTGQVLVKSSDVGYDTEWRTVGDIELSKEVDTVGVFSRVIGNDATATEQSDGSVNVAQTSTSTNTVTFKVPIDVNEDNYVTVTIKNSTMPTNMARIMIVGISPISIVGDFFIYTTSKMKYTFKLSADYLQAHGLSTFAEIGIGFSAVGEYNIAYTNKIGYSQDLSGLTETVHNMSMGTLIGKKCLFLGDSITALTGNRSWVENFLLRTSAVKVANVAVSGAWLNDYEDTVYDGDPKPSVQHNNTLGNQVQKIINNQYETPDLIIIAIGTNNGITADATRLSAAYTNYPPLADLDKTYSEGAFRYCNETLHNLYPDAKIIWCNPIPRADSQNVISAYADALRTLTNWGSAYNIETNRCGIIAANEVSEHIYLQDGLHPNQLGAEKMAEYNAAAISRLFV